MAIKRWKELIYGKRHSFFFLVIERKILKLLLHKMKRLRVLKDLLEIVDIYPGHGHIICVRDLGDTLAASGLQPNSSLRDACLARNSSCACC